MVSKIKELCTKNKTSIKALEKELGFGNGTIRRWDTSTPSVERIVMVANRFNVSVAYLTGDVLDPSDRSLTHWGELFADQKNKPAPVDGNELTETRKEFMELGESMSDDQLRQFIRIAKAMLEE